MKVHVPKTKAQPPSPETQLLELRDILLASDEFARVRGKFSRSAEELIVEDIIGCDADGIVAKKPRSRSAILRDADRLFSDFRFCTILLARLRRDGYDVAYRELLRLLHFGDYRIVGEELPPEQTHPVTLVVPNLPALLRIALIAVAHTKDKEGYPKGALLRWALHEDPHLLALMPSLARADREIFQRVNPDTFASVVSLPVAYREDALDVATILEQHPNAVPYTIGLRFDRGDCQVPYSYRMLFEWLSAAWLVNGEQGDVLSLFSRADQKRMATWQLRPRIGPMPNGSSESLKFKVAVHDANLIHFFPEGELTSRRRLTPSRTSRGCSQGRGVLTTFVPSLANHGYINLQTGSDVPPPFGLVRMGTTPTLPRLADLARDIASRPIPTEPTRPSEEVTKVG